MSTSLRSSVSYSYIWKVALPIVVGSLAQNVMISVDTIFLGRVGEVALGACALGSLFYLALIMLGIGFGTGVQIMIGRRNGEGNYSGIGRIMDHGMYFMIPVAIILFLLTYFAAPALLKYMISSEKVYEGTVEFMKYRSFGIFFALNNILFTSFYVGIVKTRILSYSTIATAIVNVVLDYLLIFGKLGFPEMGIAGAALASATAEVVTCGYFYFRTYLYEDVGKYSLFHYSRYNHGLMRRMLKLSGPLMMQNFLSFSGWFIFFMAIEHLGERALAISNICRSIYMLLMMPFWGLCSACNTLVSNFIGRGEHDEVMPLVKKIVRLSFSVAAIVVMLNVFVPRFVISLYTNNPDLIDGSVSVMYVIFVALMMFSVALVLLMAVSGTGSTRTSFGFEIFSISVYIFGAYMFAVVMVTPVWMVWTLEALYFFIVGMLSWLYLRSGKWRNVVV